ncbi:MULTISPECIES: hypothetical protein [unclassified Paenibacillus]|uniref:hypothetical protein n=1 Tax=unclassified Paenibacillus TaxID=185978 RepID=UPI002F3E50B8
MGLFGGKWIAIRTASGSRADDMDRLYAILKSNGLKAKISTEGNLKKVSVKAKDEEKARQLVEQFEKEL